MCGTGNSQMRSSASDGPAPASRSSSPKPRSPISKAWQAAAAHNAQRAEDPGRPAQPKLVSGWSPGGSPKRCTGVSAGGLLLWRPGCPDQVVGGQPAAPAPALPKQVVAAVASQKRSSRSPRGSWRAPGAAAPVSRHRFAQLTRRRGRGHAALAYCLLPLSTPGCEEGRSLAAGDHRSQGVLLVEVLEITMYGVAHVPSTVVKRPRVGVHRRTCANAGRNAQAIASRKPHMVRIRRHDA